MNVDCNGNNTGAVYVTVSGGAAAYSYNWNSGSFAYEDITGLSAGSYSVTVTDANGCSALASASVSEPPVLMATSSQTNVDCNGNATGAIDLGILMTGIMELLFRKILIIYWQEHTT